MQDGQLNVRLSKDLLDRLRVESERSGVPQARLVRDALEFSLVRLEERQGRWVRKAPEPNVGLPPEGSLDDFRFFCPASGCDFTAPSGAARCPSHGRRVASSR